MPIRLQVLVEPPFDLRRRPPNIVFGIQDVHRVFPVHALFDNVRKLFEMFQRAFFGTRDFLFRLGSNLFLSLPTVDFSPCDRRRRPGRYAR